MPASHDPKTALSSFELFSKLPNCVKFMIWEEFYLEPRYFFVTGSGTSQPDDTAKWIMEIGPSKEKYYAAIDTEIDPLASDVARRIRPEIAIEISKNPAKAEQVKINWTSDFVHLRWLDGYQRCKVLPDLEWVAKVQNLVLDETIIRLHEFDEPFEEIHPIATMLWHRRESFLSLRHLILQKPRALGRETVLKTLCFQIRYLIREAPTTPQFWKGMQVEAGSRSPWLDVERPGRTPPLQWEEFTKLWRFHPEFLPLPVSDDSIFGLPPVDTVAELDALLEEKPWPFAWSLNESEDSKDVFKDLLSLRPVVLNPSMIYYYIPGMWPKVYVPSYRAMVKKLFGGKEKDQKRMGH